VTGLVNQFTGLGVLAAGAAAGVGLVASARLTLKDNRKEEYSGDVNDIEVGATTDPLALPLTVIPTGANNTNNAAAMTNIFL
jgi:hypothetical protein